MNHYRDEEEEFNNKLKPLLQFINPAAAKEIFDNKMVEKVESTENVFFDDMAKDLKDKYTPEQLEDMMKDPEKWENINRIEKAE